MEITSTQKFIRISPQKLREVVFMIRKLKPSEAVELLPHVHKRAAVPLLKAVKTAMANALNNGLDKKDLIFKEILINEGPRYKRARPGARGRVKTYKKRLSHIRITLEARKLVKKEKANKKTKTKGTEKKQRKETKA